MKKRIVSLVMVLAMLLGMIPNIAMATEKDMVYISISRNGEFLLDQQGNPVAHLGVSLETLSAIDLDNYYAKDDMGTLGAMSAYRYDQDGDGKYEITALHLFIYVHEEVLGLNWRDVTFTGNPGSSYYNGGLFGYDSENLRYNLNGVYPIDKEQSQIMGMNWGTTSDRIVLNSGDFLDVASFTCWSFFEDELCGFCFFADNRGEITYNYNAVSKTPLTVTLMRSCESVSAPNGTEFVFDEGAEIYYGSTYGVAEKIVTVNESGCVDITFDAPGKYYLWSPGRRGTDGMHNGWSCDMENTCIVTSPAYAIVTVSDVSGSGQDSKDQAAADAVITKIAAIGTVTLASDTAIAEARTAYNALTDAQQELVNNYATLTTAEATLAALKADKAAADAVIAKIASIGTVTLDSEAVIITARDAFNSLTDAQKALVDNVSTLTAAEAKLQQLKDEAAQAAADQAAADAVIAKIASIGTVTLDSEVAINNAWNAYNDLSVAQKALITNYTTLINAQTALNQLKADAEQAAADQAAANTVIEKISAIGDVSLEDEADIIAARTAYEALTNAQKALVANYETLTAVEVRLAALKVEAADKSAAEPVIAKINAIGTVSLNSEAVIIAAREAYILLSDAQKVFVNNYDVLTAAEAKLQQLKDEAAQAAEDQEKADAAEEVITAIGKVNIFAGNKVIAAREAYDALNSNQKALVENADVLITAETTLAQLYKDAAKADHKIIFETTGNYINKLGTPSVGSVGGEWMVIDLVRAGYPCPEGYYENVVAYVKAKINDKEQLHRAKGTDNSRVILALTAAGYDVTNVAGHNLLMGLTEMSYVRNQGINGPIWALIAFDSYNYEIPTNPNATDQVTREKLIAYILEKQLADGGWALSGKSADADMTGMAIQSLAPYYSTDAKVKAAVDKALDCLSAKQSDAGTYGSIDGTSVESCAQVVVALAALGIDAETDERFTKNGISALDALCLFAIEGGGFAHVPNGELNGMATEQGQYALAAYYRFKNGQTSLYDMSDVLIRSNNTGAGTVENATDSSANAHAGALEMSSESMTDALLTEEEKAMVSNGVSVQVDLDIKDISETVLKEDKTLIEKASGKNTVALYLDITLTKQLGTASPVKVTETTDAVTVSITVPTALRNNDTKIERSYKVIRVHEGKTDILDTVYDAKSGKLTFETNAFSTYALVYSDAPAKASSPQTGDTATPWLFAGMMVLSFCGITVLTNKSKKKFS